MDFVCKLRDVSADQIIYPFHGGCVELLYLCVMSTLRTHAAHTPLVSRAEPRVINVNVCVHPSLFPQRLYI